MHDGGSLSSASPERLSLSPARPASPRSCAGSPGVGRILRAASSTIIYKGWVAMKRVTASVFFTMTFACAAFGQAAEYRITDLGTLGGPTSTPYGINNLGQVVGVSDATEAPTSRAFIWSPEPFFEYPANTMLELDPSVTTPSIARSINDASQVVGSFGGQSERAFLWVPIAFAGLPPGQMNDLGSLISGGASGGYDLSNSTSPLYVVGDSEDAPPPTSCAGAFYWRSDSQQMLPLSEQGLPLEWGTARARGVRPQVSQASDALVVGFGRTCIESSDCLEPDLKGGVAWDPATTNPSRLQIDLGEFGVNSTSEAMDVNTAGQIVGLVEASDINCNNRAVFWQNTAAVATTLETVPPGQIAVASHFNDANPIQVVGTNLDADAAVVWAADGAGFDYANLNDLTGDCDLVLLQAMDVNDQGWIVCVAGFDPPTGSTRAVLLTPYGDCREDLDGNGTVGFSDLTILLNAYGDCPVAQICTADITGNCSVGFQDLTDLLSVYDQDCPTSSPVTPTNASGGVPLPVIWLWLQIGGADALAARELDVQAVAGCITNPSPVAGTICLFLQLADL